jgi:type II secretory pathway pseudopilin PulG
LNPPEPQITPPAERARGGTFIARLLGGFVAFMAIAILGNLALIYWRDARTKQAYAETAASARNIYNAMRAMAEDGIATGNQQHGWPGDLPDRTAVEYAGRLIREKFLAETALQNLAAGPYKPAPSLTALGSQNIGFTFWRVAAADAPACFAITNRPAPSRRRRPRANPTPSQDLVIGIRKDGAGFQYRESDQRAATAAGIVPAQYPLTLIP